MQIACLLGDDFEDSEFQVPFAEFLNAGHKVSVIGLAQGQLKGKRGGILVTADEAIDDVNPEDFDALLIPGGYSPDHLRADERMVGFVSLFAQLNRPIFAVCHGPQLLITADAIRDRRITAWRTIQDDVRRMGEDVVDQQVVVDRGLVTSRQPSDLDAFSNQCLRVLEDLEAGARDADVEMRGGARGQVRPPANQRNA